MGRNKLLDFELSVVAPAVPIAKLPNDLSSCNLLQQSGQRLAQQPSVLHQLRSKQNAEHRDNRANCQIGFQDCEPSRASRKLRPFDSVDNRF